VRRTNMGVNLSDTQKWYGIATGPDGKLYCAPASASDILIIDPASGTAERTNMGANLLGIMQWYGIAEGPDGRLYCAPQSSSYVLIIEGLTSTPGLYLKDPISDDYYSLPGGEIAKQMAFGPVGVGTAT